MKALLLASLVLAGCVAPGNQTLEQVQAGLPPVLFVLNNQTGILTLIGSESRGDWTDVNMTVSGASCSLGKMPVGEFSPPQVIQVVALPGSLCQVQATYEGVFLGNWTMQAPSFTQGTPTTSQSATATTTTPAQPGNHTGEPV